MAALAFAMNSCHSAAPHDMAGWQRASQSFHVSQTQSLESRSELFDSALEAKDGKIGLVFPLTLPGLFTTWTLLLRNIASG